MSKKNKNQQAEIHESQYNSVYNSCIRKIKETKMRLKETEDEDVISKIEKECAIFIYEAFVMNSLSINDLNKDKDERLNRVFKLDINGIKEVISPYNEIYKYYYDGKLIAETSATKPKTMVYQKAA